MRHGRRRALAVVAAGLIASCATDPVSPHEAAAVVSAIGEAAVAGPEGDLCRYSTSPSTCEEWLPTVETLPTTEPTVVCTHPFGPVARVVASIGRDGTGEPYRSLVVVDPDGVRNLEALWRAADEVIYNDEVITWEDVAAGCQPS